MNKNLRSKEKEVQFCIGKTAIRTTSNRLQEIKDPRKWTKNTSESGIANRWNKTYQKNYTFMVPIGVVHGHILETKNYVKHSAERYCFDLEEDLVEIFLVKEKNSCLNQTVYKRGDADGNHRKAYCIYVSVLISNVFF